MPEKIAVIGEKRLRRNAAAREYYYKNRESIIEKQRAYKAATKEARNAASIAWRKANPERVSAIKRHYREKHAEKVSAYNKANGRRRHAEYRAWMDEQKSRPCLDCGGSYAPAVMDFHHRDPATKEFSLYRSSWKDRDAVVAEIAKCDLLCANCHRLKHHG